VNMDQFNCFSFEIEFNLKREDFDETAFCEDTKVDLSVDVGHAWSYGSGDTEGEIHAHLLFDHSPDPKKDLTFTISFHKSTKKIDDVRPPYAEDCVQWLSKFIRPKEVAVFIDARFRFGEDYIPVFSLPFPLISTSEELAGCEVDALGIKFPEASALTRALIQIRNKRTRIDAQSKKTINLESFELEPMISDLFAAVAVLMKKIGDE